MILSSVLGAITGLAGSIGTKFLSLKELKLKNEHQIAMVKAETNAMIEETKANIKITETEVAGELSIAQQSSFDIAQQFGNKTNIPSEVIMSLVNHDKGFPRFVGVTLAMLLGVVDVFRTSIRPAITVISLIMCGYMFQNSWDIINKQFNQIDPLEIIALVESIWYMITTVVFYWFGERGLKKLRKG